MKQVIGEMRSTETYSPPPRRGLPEGEPGRKVEISHKAHRIAQGIGHVDIHELSEQQVQTIMQGCSEASYQHEADESGYLECCFHQSLYFFAAKITYFSKKVVLLQTNKQNCMNNQRIIFWLIALLSILVLVPFLGESLFYSKGEPREAIVAVSMLQSGNWILPVNYGTDIAFKPPFLYWCIAAVSWLSGEVSEFTTRFPSAVACIGMLLFFFHFVRKRLGQELAVLTTLLLLTSFEVHRAAVAGRVDMVQVAFIVVSLCLFYEWDEQGRQRFPWVAIGCMACATLTKGPVGAIFPCMVTGVYLLIQQRGFWKSFGWMCSFGFLAILPYCGWMFLAYQQGGQEVIDLMLEENTGRFSGTMSYASHENPVWYNFLTLIWGWIPWTLLFVASLFTLKRKALDDKSAQSAEATRGWMSCVRGWWKRFCQQDPLQLFCWLAVLLIFIFYCIPKSKRSVYLLPIYPFMALFFAQYLRHLAERGSKLFRSFSIVFGSLGVLLTLLLFAIRLGLVPDAIMGHGRHAAENVGFLHALRDTYFDFAHWLLILIPLVGALCLFRLCRQQASARAHLYGVAGMLLCLFVALDGVYQPTVLSTKSDKKIAQRLINLQPEGAIYSYGLYFYSINYYLGDRLRHIEREKPAKGYLIVPVFEEEKMLTELSKRYEMKPVFQTSYRSCDARAQVVCYYFYPLHR